MSLSPVDDEPKIMRTAHAMLVPWGIFASQIGLVQGLEKVPIAQRKRDYEPQTKLIEFLAAILSGCRYLQDISHGPHPLDRDQAVATAWGQPGWADYSGVSRTRGGGRSQPAIHRPGGCALLATDRRVDL